MAWWAEAATVGEVPPSVFLPRPNVGSSLVSLHRHPPPDGDYTRFKEVVRAGFAHRRKMLRTALAGVVVPEAFLAVGVPPTARAQDLGLGEWCRLAGWAPRSPTPS